MHIETDRLDHRGQSLDSYYENVIPWSSQSMRESLHETIDDHERFPYTSSEIDTWDILEEADRIIAG